MQPARFSPLSLSQNFLTSRALVDRLLTASSICTGDLVFDLGAGSGLIAERLARRGCDVVAVETDPGLAQMLTVRFADEPQVRVYRGDVRKMALPHRPYKVFANIPFDATAAIVDRLTHASCPPEDSYLVMQREAAMRFVGQPRGTLVATLLRPWFAPAIVHRFRRTDFVPAPHVEVVMLRLHKRGAPACADRGCATLSRFRRVDVHRPSAVSCGEPPPTGRVASRAPGRRARGPGPAGNSI